jgi:hypothetical protein
MPEDAGPATTVEAAALTPPYNIPFRTFLNLLLRLQEEGVPPRIDRSFLKSMAGRDQTYLMAALRFFSLIDTDGTVSPTLETLAEGDEQRRRLFGQLLRDKFPQPVQLSEKKATQAMLEEGFAEYGLAPDSKRKAITFFLKALQYAELPMSPYFAVPRERSPRPRTAKKDKKPKSTPGKEQEDQPPSPPRGKSLTEARQRYLEILLAKVEEAGSSDQDLLDRVERLLGFQEEEGGGG